VDERGAVTVTGVTRGYYRAVVPVTATLAAVTTGYVRVR
jgi:hypothetical protein